MNSSTKGLLFIDNRHLAAAIKKLCDLHCRFRKCFTQTKFCSADQATFGSSWLKRAGKASMDKPVSKDIVLRLISYSPAWLQCLLVQR